MSRKRCLKCRRKISVDRLRSDGLCADCVEYAPIAALTVAKPAIVMPGDSSAIMNVMRSLQTPTLPANDLINRAADQFRSQREQYVIQQVKLILERVSSIERIQRKHERQMLLLRGQLNAIHSGRYGVNEQTLLIVFEDELLNIPWDDTAS